MENLIFALIVFVIITLVQFFIKRASKAGGQSSKQSSFTSIFEQIKNEFKETINENNDDKTPKSFYHEYENTEAERHTKKESVYASNIEKPEKKEIKKEEQQNPYIIEPQLDILDKINNLPQIQSAIIWKEVLDKPKSYHIDDYFDD
ncbi:MAG: hypothetical protein JXB50_00805 [Spirochaetes bacterium]|nr:hypothetical protein [Spirochaetota bacterium]